MAPAGRTAAALPDFGPWGRCAVSITHCPLCVALALLCVLRSSAHLLVLWQLWGRRPSGNLVLQLA